MATQSGVFTFALPEDVDANQLRIYSSSTKDGTYSLVTTVTYEYGTTTHEYDSLDDTTWYKIQFNNSVDSEAGPISDPVYGGDFANAAPFLAISTTTDGANYATVQDLYDYSGLTTLDISVSNVSRALKRARALVDLFMNEADLERFDLYETEIARKKYNASLAILKEAEINLALGIAYRDLSDKKIIEDLRSTTGDTTDIRIGATALSSNSSTRRPETIAFLAALSDRYSRYGRQLLDALQPKSIKLTPVDTTAVRSPKFRLPFNGY